MSKIIITLLIVIGIIYFINRSFGNKITSLINRTPSPTPTVENWLPTNWSQTDSTDNQIKLVKQVSSGLKPEIVLQKSENKDKTEFKIYSNRLIAGAKSALPSLRYLKDDLQTNSRVVSGYYYNQKNKVLISQRIIQKESTVYTLTASYGDIALESEINSIFDSIVVKRLSN